MPTIRQLPPSLVNKIAAGEVIERPASVVKELLENSIDAGARSIELTIEGGGIELIRISDDGCGIDEEQIPLALASHATSKLQSADDLFDVHTLGFRGEALASIAEVSHLVLKTRTAASDSGTEVRVQGGAAEPLQPTGCPVGTTIEVRHLFFNTPVRKKFLKTPPTEAGHITEAFTRIALAFPEVSMKMISGNRTVYDLAETTSWQERIAAFFGDEIAQALIPVSSQQDQAQLSGFVADPSVSRSNNRMQYLFLNGRYIRDRSLQHALGEAYRGLLMVGRFPICFLRLELPPDQVDVNVHPTKMEVRFQESGKLYSQLLKTLRHEFLTSDLTARARHVPGPVPQGLVSPASGPSSGAPARVPAQHGSGPTSSQPVSAPTGQSPVAAELGSALTRDDTRWSSHAEQMAQVSSGPRPTPHLNLPEQIPPFRPFDRPDSSSTYLPNSPPPEEQEASETSADGAQQPATSRLGFQLHNRYLVTQDESGMVVIDQHALHERIMYEQLRTKVESRSLERQKLLVPESLDLTPAEAAAAIEFQEILAEIGIEIEPFGGDTILMHSYPAMLTKLRPGEVLRQVLEPLMAGGKEPSSREILDELLHMMACKAAIKAGDKLATEEITALLEQRDHYQNTHHCPHGRPTALFFSREQLDKMFGRT